MTSRVAAPTGLADSSAATIYAHLVLEQAPRVLSLMDRERVSRTAGCMDRTYWAWKFVDFPGARFQEGLFTLAFLYANGIPGNTPYRRAALLDWIASGLRFWCRIQHRDGSFDEAYPFERSLAATAFTSFYIAEALALVREDLPDEVNAKTTETLARAGRWLVRNDETHGFLSNHQAAAAAALAHAHQWTGDPEFEQRSRHFVRRILARQSKEGWYDEYGGADPGYQTHGTFYLARLLELSGDEELADSIERSMSFLAHFIHPDRSLGGEYASRNTQTYYPAAFEMLAARSGVASWIAETMRASVATASAAGLRSIDIYNYFPILNNLAFAWRARARGHVTAEPVEPSADSPLVWFPEAGIARVRRARYDAWVGVSKGGVLKVFDRTNARLVCSDCGYIGELSETSFATTQHHDGTRTAVIEPAQIELSGNLVAAARPTMRPARFAAFRLFMLTLGRSAHAGRWLKRQLVRVLIHRKRSLDAGFRRILQFEDSRVVITDHLHGPALMRLRSLERAAVFTTIHMGSSRYFIANELEAQEVEQSNEAIDPARAAGGLTLRRVVELG